VPRVFHVSLVRGSTFFKPVNSSSPASLPTLLYPAVPPGRRGNLVRDFLISRACPAGKNSLGERKSARDSPKSLSRSILRIRPRRFASSRHVEDSEQQLTHEYAIKRPFAPAAARVWQTSARARARGQSVGALSSINCVVRLTKGTGVK